MSIPVPNHAVASYAVDPDDPFPEGFTVADIWQGVDAQPGGRMSESIRIPSDRVLSVV